MEVQRVLWHTHGGQWYFHEQHDPFRLAECIDYQLLLRFYFESSCSFHSNPFYSEFLFLGTLSPDLEKWLPPENYFPWRCSVFSGAFNFWHRLIELRSEMCLFRLLLFFPTWWNMFISSNACSSVIAFPLEHCSFPAINILSRHRCTVTRPSPYFSLGY